MEAYQNCTPIDNIDSYLIFKESKRSLKDLAKKGELPEELRARVLLILSQRGFNGGRTAPRFHGCSIHSTKILFYSPRLWQLLYNPEAHPVESAILNDLSDEVFQLLIETHPFARLTPFPIKDLIEINRVLSALKIPEQEWGYKDALENQVEQSPDLVLEIKTLYMLSTIWPANKKEIFSKLLKPLPFPKEFLQEDVVAELECFTRMSAGSFAEESQNLPPETLYRFWLFLQSEIKVNQELHPLYLRVLDFLLTSIRSGELDPDYSAEIVKVAKGSIDVQKRLDRDTIVIELEGVTKVSVSQWPLFAQSDFFRAMLQPGMRPAEKIFLEGNKAKVFFLFYNHLIKGRCLLDDELNALPMDQLLGVLECAAFFQLRNFAETRARIANVIIKNCVNHPESIAKLAEIAGIMDVPELEKRVISWLKSYVMIENDGARYSVKILVNESLFGGIRTSIGVLKILKETGRLSKIEFEGNKDTLLQLLSGVYYCNQLKLFEEKKRFEDKLLNLTELVRVDFSIPHIWGRPITAILLLSELSEPVAAHILGVISKFKEMPDAPDSSKFWIMLKDLTEGADAASLKIDKKMTELSAKAFPCFLYSLPFTELEVRGEEITLELIRRIKQKQLDFKLFKELIEECQRFFHKKRGFFNNLRIGIDYSIVSVLQVPLDLLHRMGSQVFLKRKIGSEFDHIPLESAQWAIDFLDKVLSKVALPLPSNEEAKTFPAAHFQALQILHKKCVGHSNDQIMQAAEQFCPLASWFLPETLLTAAAFSVSIGCSPLFESCIRAYCGHEDFPLGVKYSNELQLFSLTDSSLRLLKAVGKDLHRLDIIVKSQDKEQNPGMQVVEACPNIEHLGLYNGAVPLLESLPLAQLPLLQKLTIYPQSPESWESLRGVKIPEIEQINLCGTLDDIEQANAYEFLKSLPTMGVKLSIYNGQKEKGAGILSMVWNPWSDPTDTFFASLSHCIEMSIAGSVQDSLKYLIRHNGRLEKLNLIYNEAYAMIEDLEILLDHLPNLKKCDVEINFTKFQPTRKEIIDYLQNLRNLRNGNVDITNKQLDELIPKEKSEKKDLPQIAFKFNFASSGHRVRK